ncbi:polysaccharide pyruvyl transferase family protein [Amphibacillus sp. Q70]|uniref:polysaccharide pyruvyl transferase family protein n=1 Tax=Amphibacillus sp. Q70 TaxID=3453416 RepID=UPI003F876BCD
MKKILLINQGKTENLGDKAINIVFHELLMEHRCTVDFAGFAQTNEQFIDEMEFRKKRSLHSTIKHFTPDFLIWFFKYRKKINREFSMIKNKNYDLVVIGGGQLIKTKNVFVFTLLTWVGIIKKMSCPIILAGIGVDTTYSIIEKKLYRKVLPNIDEIYVRDKVSQKILNEEFNVSSNYIPDVVFAYSRFFPQDVDINKKNKLLIMIYDYNALKDNFETKFKTIYEYFNYWEKLIEQNMENNLEIVLGYTTIGDKRTTYEFSEYLKRKSNIKFSIKNTDRLSDFSNLLKDTKVLISGRMHGMLLGLNYKCEIVPYVISSKIEAFKDEWLDKKFNIDDVNIEIDKTLESLLGNIRY